MYAEELSSLLSQPLNPNREENAVRCPLHDDRHASMSINLRKGVWNCLGCGKGGPLHTLFQFLGSDLDKGARAILRANTDPDPEPVDFREKYNEFRSIRITTPEVQEYMREKGVLYEVMEEAGIRYDARGTLVMPYFDGDRVVALRYRGRNNFKWYESGSERTIYGLNEIRGKRQVILCEGESDTHSMRSLLRRTGVDDVVVGGIAGANSSVEKWELWALDLMYAKEVWIAFDADEAGDKGAERAIETLGSIAKRLRPTKEKDWADAIAAGEKIDLA